ncbi:hypothetical protein L6R52_26710 [Myxococcota bacterium]|nr:hypothetical protein [Myxococcota bacterium]
MSVRRERSAPNGTRALVTAAALTLAACDRDARVFFDHTKIPDDVAWIGAIVTDAEGSYVTATGLVPVDDGPLRFDALPARGTLAVELLGWTRATIEAIGGPPSEAALADGQLREAEGCDPVLPGADWGARLDEDGATLPALPTPRRLNTQWLDTTCPSLVGRLASDVRCQLLPCGYFETQSGCTLTVELAPCNQGSHRFQVDWRGELCALESSLPECSFVEARTPAIASLDCVDPSRCEVDVYRRVDGPFEADTVPLLTGAPQREQSEVGEFAVRAWMPRTGYVSGLAVLRDHVAVTTNDGVFLDRTACSDVPTRTYFVDRATMQVAGTATTPPCLRELLAWPSGRGLWGVAGSTRARSLVELDETGRLLGQHPLVLPESDVRGYESTSILLTRDRRQLFVLFHWMRSRAPMDEPDHGATIVALDPATWTQRVLYDQTPRIAWAMTEGDEDQLALVDESDDAVRFVDVTSGIETIDARELFHVTSISSGAIMYYAPNRTFLVPTVGIEPVMHVLRLEEGNAEPITFFEHDAGPMFAAPWPPSPDFVAVASATPGQRGPRNVYISLFDPRTRRFLPGSTRIGWGLPGQLTSDGEHLWVTLPWEGSLVRITPR